MATKGNLLGAGGGVDGDQRGSRLGEPAVGAGHREEPRLVRRQRQGGGVVAGGAELTHRTVRLEGEEHGGSSVTA